MKLLFIVGSSAVGKMTVGQELMKITEFRLFHNHMTIEPVIEVLGYFDVRAVVRLREVFFREFAASDNYGMIFTFMWAFDMKSNWDYIEHIKSVFLEQKPDTEFFYVELVAPLEVRIERNVTENRLKNKPSKNDLELSNELLIRDSTRHRFESYDGEIPFENYIKIDSSEISPDAVAAIIKQRFNL